MASGPPKAIIRSSRYVSCLDTICLICSELYKIDDLPEISNLIFDAFILLLLESLNLLGYHRHIAHWRAEFYLAKKYVSPERALDIVGIPPLKMKFESEEQDHACRFVDRRLVTFSPEQLLNDPDLRTAFRHAYAEAASFDVLCRPLYHFQATLFPAIRDRLYYNESQSSPALPTPTRTPSPLYANTPLARLTHSLGGQTSSYGPRVCVSLESLRQAAVAAIRANQILRSKMLLFEKSLTASDLQSPPSTPEISTTLSLQDKHETT